MRDRENANRTPKSPPLHVPLTLEQLAEGLLNTPPRAKEPTEADVKTPKAKPKAGAKKASRKKKP